MAGGAKTKNQLATLDSTASQIWAMVEEGQSLRKMAAALRERGVDCSKTVLHTWLSREDNKARWKPAMHARAAVLVEEAAEIAESASPETVAVAREQIKVRQWEAERLHKEQWGAGQTNVNLQINLAEAFVQVMREKA